MASPGLKTNYIAYINNKRLILDLKVSLGRACYNKFKQKLCFLDVLSRIITKHVKNNGINELLYPFALTPNLFLIFLHLNIMYRKFLGKNIHSPPSNGLGVPFMLLVVNHNNY